MLIIPAIELREGISTRALAEWDDDEPVFPLNPQSVAQTWRNMGAQYIHVGDLDGAFSGHCDNLAAIKKILEVDGIEIQVGGGIRNMDTIDMLLDAGVKRVVLGTVAITNHQLVQEACKKYGDRIVISIDSRDGMVLMEGWKAGVPTTVLEMVRVMEQLGVSYIVYHDSNRAGKLKGPDFSHMLPVLEATNMKVIISGGISSLADIQGIKALNHENIFGAILGKALYTKDINLQVAISEAAK